MQHPFVPDGQEEIEDSLERSVILPRQSRLLFQHQQHSGGGDTVVANKRGKRSRSQEANIKGRSTAASVGRASGRVQLAAVALQQEGNTATTDGEEETQDVPTPFHGNSVQDEAEHLSLVNGICSPEPSFPKTSSKQGAATGQRTNHQQRVAGLTTTGIRPPAAVAQTNTKTAARPHQAPAPHSNVVATTIRTGGHFINETPVNVSTQLQFDEPVTATQGVQGERMYPQPSPPPLFQLGGSTPRREEQGTLLVGAEAEAGSPNNNLSHQNQSVGGTQRTTRSGAPDQPIMSTQHAKKVWEEQMNGFFNFIDDQHIAVVEN